MLRLLAPLLALFFALAPTAAFADDDREVAKAQFKEAKRLYDDENYQPALQLFQLAWQFSGSPNARLFIGKCHLALEQYEEAYNELQGTLEDAAKTGDPSYDNTRRAAAAELALIEPRVGRLFVVLADPERPTEVTVGGKPFERLGEAVAMDTGAVEVKATSDGQEAMVRPTVVAGETTSVALYFPPKPEEAGTVSTTPLPPPESGYTPLQVGGFIAIGAGGAILVGGGILGALAAGRFQALDGACEGQRCDDPGVADVVDTGKTFELISYIMLGVGGAGALTGGALVLFGGEDDDVAEEEGASAALDVAPLPGGGLLQLTGRF